MTRVWFLLALPIIAGCATTITAPAGVRDPATVYIADYGRHASLVLPADGRYVEYAFGEWRWFALGESGPIRAPGVLLIPGEGTLGRRELPRPHPDLPAEHWIGAVRVQEMTVERSRAEALMLRLDRWIAANDEAHVIGPDGMVFVRVPQRYHGLRNSNTVVAEWLGSLGATVRGPAILSSFEVSPAIVRTPRSPRAPLASPESSPPGPAPPSP